MPTSAANHAPIGMCWRYSKGRGRAPEIRHFQAFASDIRRFARVPRLRHFDRRSVMMPTPRTHRFRLILAAIDFSPESAKALRYAVATARTCGGRVVAAHAIDPLLSAAAARAYSERVLIADAVVALARFVRTTLGAADAGAVESNVVIGPPRQTLIAEAQRRHADVVVLGTHGLGGVSKAFFGSTTEALLRRYHGSVMVVPPRCPNPPEQWPGPSIVAAIATEPHRRAMVSAAARAASVFGAWLTVRKSTEREPRSRWHRGSLVVLPLPDTSRLRTFKQGTQAYEFVRRARGPVLVIRTGHPIGHVGSARQAA
jgi:nucleotide-binding universal stress UspA family protein